MIQWISLRCLNIEILDDYKIVAIYGNPWSVYNLFATFLVLSQFRTILNFMHMCNLLLMENSCYILEFFRKGKYKSMGILFLGTPRETLYITESRHVFILYVLELGSCSTSFTLNLVLILFLL